MVRCQENTFSSDHSFLTFCNNFLFVLRHALALQYFGKVSFSCSVKRPLHLTFNIFLSTGMLDWAQKCPASYRLSYFSCECLKSQENIFSVLKMGPVAKDHPWPGSICGCQQPASSLQHNQALIPFSCWAHPDPKIGRWGNAAASWLWPKRVVGWVFFVRFCQNRKSELAHTKHI